MNDASPRRHDKFSAYRARKKASGLREVRLWLPDVRSAAFRKEVARQSLLLDHSADEREAADLMTRAATESWDNAD